MMKHEYSSFEISSAKVFYFVSNWYLENWFAFGDSNVPYYVGIMSEWLAVLTSQSPPGVGIV
jgi:hypothetical protein